MSQLTPAEKNAEFLAKVAEGDRICWNAQAKQAETAKAVHQYAFQGRTFEPSSTFQPQLTRPSWTYSSEPW